MAIPDDSNFAGVPIEIDADVLIDQGIEYLRAAWDGFNPSEGDPEVIVLEALGPLAQAVATIAAAMDKAALIAFGTKVKNLPYELGTPARANVTLHTVDDAGYLIPVGGQFEIDGFAFALTENVAVSAGATSAADVIATCAVIGADANGLPGDTVASLTLPSFVTSIDLISPTYGGNDDENDSAYLNRVAREEQLRGKTLVTAEDFAAEAKLQPLIGRVYAVGNTANEVNVWVTGLDGEAADADVKTALANIYATFRMALVDWDINDPDYNVVDVAWTAKGTASADPAAIEAAVNASLTRLLNPLTWSAGTLRGEGGVWTGENVVRKNVLIGLIEQHPSIRYVETVTITSPTSGSHAETNGDLTMNGAVPLPRAGTISGVVD